MYIVNLDQKSWIPLPLHRSNRLTKTNSSASSSIQFREKCWWTKSLRHMLLWRSNISRRISKIKFSNKEKNNSNRDTNKKTAVCKIIMNNQTYLIKLDMAAMKEICSILKLVDMRWHLIKSRNSRNQTQILQQRRKLIRVVVILLLNKTDMESWS